MYRRLISATLLVRKAVKFVIFRRGFNFLNNNKKKSCSFFNVLRIFIFQANFKVAVYIPNSDTLVQNVLVVGVKNAVESAQRYIEKIVHQVDQAAADREASYLAEREQRAEEPEEEWMAQYTYKRPSPTVPSAIPVSVAPPNLLDDNAENIPISNPGNADPSDDPSGKGADPLDGDVAVTTNGEKAWGPSQKSW